MPLLARSFAQDLRTRRVSEGQPGWYCTALIFVLAALFVGLLFGGCADTRSTGPAASGKPAQASPVTATQDVPAKVPKEVPDATEALEKAPEAAPEEGPADGPAELKNPLAGELAVISYNIAGLPEGISSSHPARNIPLIGPKLATFDIAFLQEDFAYHPRLAASCPLPFMTRHWRGGFFGLGDGLTIASARPILEWRRFTWAKFHGIFGSGSDSLTPKGFLAAWIDMGGGARLLAVDLHMDAGKSSGDIAARTAQAAQLATWLSGEEGLPLIVAGDFNLNENERREADRRIFKEFLGATGLVDSYPADKGGRGPIDKILYRPGGGLTLEAKDWAQDSASFRDAQNAQLSDHLPVRVRFLLGNEGSKPTPRAGPDR